MPPVAGSSAVATMGLARGKSMPPWFLASPSARTRRLKVVGEATPELAHGRTGGAEPASERALLVPQDDEEDRRGENERDHGRRHVYGWDIDVHDRLLRPS